MWTVPGGPPGLAPLPHADHLPRTVPTEGPVTKRMLVALLALAGLFLSSYLTLYKLGFIGHLACAAGTCELVQLSRWSVLFGVPVAAWGAMFYLATLAVAVAGTQPRFADDRRVSWILVSLTGWGVLFSAYLTILELFVIHAICEYCVTSAALVTVMFAVCLREWRSATLAELSADESPPR
jgi:uncharacterized membrane protein